MAEHLLDAAQVGASLEQVRCERVAQEVGVDAARLEPCLVGEAAEDEERARPGERSAAGVEEEVGPVSTVEVRPAEREVAAHGFDRGAAERHDPLLAALAEHADELPFEVDRRAREADASETRRPAP